MSRISITPVIVKDDFIKMSNEIYGADKFDFSLIPETFKKTDRLQIICLKHGQFQTSYYMFIDKKSGCKECIKEENKEQRRLYYQQKFIEESTKVHNGFYNYDKVNYQGKDVKVIITCPIHGDFEQTPHEHKAGSGCKECAHQRLIEINHKSTEWFVERANKVHNGFYNYDKTDYKTSNEKVIITCPIHGDFEILPSSHLSGHGCPKCANSRKGYGKGNKPVAKTTEQFIEESKQIFGENTFDYSKTNYINARTPVIITCPTHGDFYVRPNTHLSSKRGCPVCAIENIKEQYSYNTKDFIRRSKEIFGDFYIYDKTVYVNNRTNVIITCPIHGDFEISPLKHLSARHGCPECGKIKSNDANRYTTEDFIRVGNIKFNGFYDYSQTEFKGMFEDVDIICPIHGKFTTKAYAHLKGNGECPECKKQRMALTFEDFLIIANKIFKNYYNYDEINIDDYDYYKEVKIICPKHGSFYVTPYNHIRNYQGCPECNITNLERDINSLLINNSIDFEIQKTFEWLKFKKNLYLDVYIDSIKVAIECQGIQHFKLCEFYGFDNDSFELYKQRDRQKKELCEQHGIKILYYSDIQYDENYELGKLYTDKDELLNIILNMLNDTNL